MEATAETFAYGPSRPKRRKGYRFAGLVVGWLAVAGIAFAVWSVQSDGSGFARSGQLSAPVLGMIGKPELTGDLLPGGTGALVFKVTNENSVPLRITAYTLQSGVIVDDEGACSGSNFTVAGQSGLSIPVPLGGPTLISVPNAISLSSAAPTGCQDRLVQVPVRATFSTT